MALNVPAGHCKHVKGVVAPSVVEYRPLLHWRQVPIVAWPEFKE